MPCNYGAFLFSQNCIFAALFLPKSKGRLCRIVSCYYDLKAVLQNNCKGANLIIAWADLLAKLPIEF